MAITEYRPREEYVGTGSLDTYSFGFKVAALAQIEVIVFDDATPPVETFRVRGTDTTYLDTVTFDAVDGGGEIILVDNLPSAHHLLILQANDTPLQEVEFKNKRDFTLARIEAALDVINGQIQRLNYKADRSLRLPEHVLDAVDFNTELDLIGGDYLLAIHEDGNRFVRGPSVPYLEALVAAAEAAETGSLAAEASAIAQAAAAAASAAAALVSQNAAAVSAAQASADRILAGVSAAEAAVSQAAALVSEAAAAASAAAALASQASATASAAAALASQIAAANSAVAADASAQAAAISEAAAAAAVFGVLSYPPIITAAGAEAPAPGPLSSTSYRFDATLGNQSLTLPAIADPGDDGLMYEVFKIDNSVNTVTITGTVSGEVDPVIEYQWTRRMVKAISGAWYWVG